MAVSGCLLRICSPEIWTILYITSGELRQMFLASGSRLHFQLFYYPSMIYFVAVTVSDEAFYIQEIAANSRMLREISTITNK